MSTAAIARAAIINDDERDQDMWSLQVEEAGYEPYVVRRPQGHAFGSVDELALVVESNAKFAVFDHRLAQGDMAQFTGAEIVAALYDRHQTAPLLVTTYDRIDKDTTIRLHRRKVPILLSSENFDDPETIRECFRICGQEVWDGVLSLQRRPWRTIIQIEEVDFKIKTVDALVPGWNPDVKVRFPLDLIDRYLHDRVESGRHFFARVNTCAEREEDLFFYDFELAPEVDPNDGLA
jgi:hypothetical protein